MLVGMALFIISIKSKQFASHKTDELGVEDTLTKI